jgi:hypothetical protein
MNAPSPKVFLMLTRWLLSLLLLFPALSRGADTVFSADGKRVWMNLSEGKLGYLDIDDRENTTESDRQINVIQGGVGPKIIQSLAMSKAGNLLLAAPDAVWAFNPATSKIVRVAAMPAGFDIGDMAYQETTGAIFVSGWFTRADHTVERMAAFLIAKGSDKAEPVYITGIDSIIAAAFDSGGQLYLGVGPDLWGGELVATEHEQASDYAWQFRGFRLAGLGTPLSGEGSNASQVISSLFAGGGRLTITMRGSEGGTILRLPTPAMPHYEGGGPLDRVLPLKARWAFQQKVTGSVQFVTPPDALPRLPIVAVSADGARIVYQTAATGVRRWWLLEKTGKPRMFKEESD